MKHVKTLNTNTLKDTMKKGGCGECQQIQPLQGIDVEGSPQQRQEHPISKPGYPICKVRIYTDILLPIHR